MKSSEDSFTALKFIPKMF